MKIREVLGKQCMCGHKTLLRQKSQAMHMAHHMRKTLISASADLRIFLLVGKRPKPFESQVPCELRTLQALEYCS